MAKNNQKTKMTLDKLAVMAHGEFLAIRKDMVTKDYLDEKLEHFATKDDLKHFATKDDFQEMKSDIIEEVRKENVKVIQSNDKVVTKLAILLKEESARTEQYRRQEKAIETLKQKVAV